MKVSVLIPVYNKAPYLRDCLDSVYAQTHADLEVLAVDDASTDESLALLRAETDPRLRVIALQENRGPGVAANAGLEAATGTYIVRLDADDIALPDRVERQVAYMEAHPEVGASGGRVDLFGAEGASRAFPLEHDACMAELLFGVPVSQGASILRTSTIREHELRYEPSWPRIGEDWLFWTRMGHVARFGNIAAPVIRYRRGAQNLGHGRDKVADHEVLLREVFAWYGIPLSERDLTLHLLTLRLFREAPTAGLVEAYRDWLDRLQALVLERDLFPGEAFRRRIATAWGGLFHYLADRDRGAALAHLRLSGWRRDHALYLMKHWTHGLLRPRHRR